MKRRNKMKFKVWWIPQVGSGCGRFEYPVSSRKIGLTVCDILADYDIFQFQHNIKPDYSNVGGVVCWAKPISENEDDWFDVPEDDNEWKDYLDEINDYEKSQLKG